MLAENIWLWIGQNESKKKKKTVNMVNLIVLFTLFCIEWLRASSKTIIIMNRFAPIRLKLCSLFNKSLARKNSVLHNCVGVIRFDW